jgi:PAS domain S-box-containing protein
MDTKILKNELDKFQAFFEFSENAMLVFDSDFNILHVNKKFEALSGYSRKELNHKIIATQFFRHNVIATIFENEYNSNTTNLHTEFICKNGTLKLVEINRSRLPAHQIHLFSLADITEKRSIQNRLVQQNLQILTLNSLFMATSEFTDLNGILKIALESAMKIIPSTIGFIHLWDLPKGLLKLAFHNGLERTEEERLQSLKKSSDPWWKLIRKREAIFVGDTQRFPYHHPLENSNLKTICYLPLSYKKKLSGVLTIGCTEQQELTEDQQKLLELITFQVAVAMEYARLQKEQTLKSKEIQEKNQELQSFIYTVSHDLKTPLVALYGFSDLLRENYSPLLDEVGQDYLKRILMNAELMHQMIDDLLELSRIGRVVGPRIKFSIRRLIEEFAAMFEYQLRQKGIQLIYPKKMPLIYADRDRIATVFQNLLTNAIKFSRVGCDPKIVVDWKEAESDYLFWVADNGVGILPEHHTKIFELFQKFSGSQTEGTGIGLTIVKKILEHHNGKIWVESAINEGAKFYFTIPKAVRSKK